MRHFSHSWEKSLALWEAQRELNLPEHAMVTDRSIQWGFTQKMIARVLEQQNALSKVLSTDHKVTPTALMAGAGICEQGTRSTPV